MKIDLEQIRELLQVVSATEVTELTIEFGDQRITVKKAITVTETSAKPIVVKTEVAQSQPVSTTKPQAVAQAVPAGVPEQTPAPNNNDSYNGSGDASKNGHVEITSPMVGTFYRSPSPEAAPFVNIGDHVTVGQTVCIIEAMKLMNDMPSEVSGKIVKILVDNGTTVEYGQPLFLLDPKG